MPSAYATPPSPAIPCTPLTPADCDRIAAVLAELAAMPTLLARPESCRFVPVAPLDLCGACPEAGTVSDGDAVLCHLGSESGYVYRESVCALHLSEAATYELLQSRNTQVWVEIPLTFDQPRRVYGCSCNPSYGQSCPVCDGTLAEQAGRI